MIGCLTAHKRQALIFLLQIYWHFYPWQYLRNNCRGRGLTQEDSVSTVESINYKQATFKNKLSSDLLVHHSYLSDSKDKGTKHTGGSLQLSRPALEFQSFSIRLELLVEEHFSF